MSTMAPITRKRKVICRAIRDDRSVWHGRTRITLRSIRATIVAACAGSIQAAVPLTQVREWQRRAPEALSITALSVDRASATHPYGNGGSVTTTNVTLTAKVDVENTYVLACAFGCLERL
jgi:hypothetical protein